MSSYKVEIYFKRCLQGCWYTHRLCVLSELCIFVTFDQCHIGLIDLNSLERLSLNLWVNISGLKVV